MYHAVTPLPRRIAACNWSQSFDHDICPLSGFISLIRHEELAPARKRKNQVTQLSDTLRLPGSFGQRTRPSIACFMVPSDRNKFKHIFVRRMGNEWVCPGRRSIEGAFSGRRWRDTNEVCKGLKGGAHVMNDNCFLYDRNRNTINLH